MLHNNYLYWFCLSVFALAMFSRGEVNAAQVDILAQVEQLRVVNEKKITAAFEAMAAVKQAGAYIDSFSDLVESGEITLPVGVRKGDYELIIREITYNQETGKNRVYASCAFKFKEDGQKIAFDGYADIEGQKGLGTNGFLELISPVRRDLGHGLILVFNVGTKVNFGCDGVESFYAKMDLLVDSTKIKPVDANGNCTGGMLSTSFDSYFDDFDNFTASLDFNQSFGFEGLDGFVFTLHGATLDQSDESTPAMAVFPQDYGVEADETMRNLWKGVAVTSASVVLPNFFSKSSTNPEGDQEKPMTDRITLALENVIIDANGFSAKSVTSPDIFSSELLDKDKWDISLREFSLELLKGDVAGLGFGGDINIPPFGKNSLLPYKASFNHSTNNYDFQIGLSGKYDFPVLGSTVDLNSNSYIEIEVANGGIYPTINACGLLSVNAPLSNRDDAKKLKIPDIPFENMQISRSAPYFKIGSVGLTGELKSPELAGFQLKIDSIAPFNNDEGSGLAFNVGVKLSEIFGGNAGVQLYGDYVGWKFDHVGVDEIFVDYKSGGYSMSGSVKFEDGDEIYGTGFRGDITFGLLNKFQFDAVAVFGKKDDYRYFLTDVFYETSPASGLILAPTPISFYGFGGGLYRKMQQSSGLGAHSDFGKSLSGINYVPDKSVGMGFMTSTKFGLAGVSAAFNSKVSFEIQFNDDGGLNFVQLRGDAAFMDDPAKWGGLADNINEAVGKLEQKGGKLKLSAKSDLAIPENKKSGFLTASLLMEYDAANHVFNADLNSYLNAGFIKGVGDNDRMGWASIRIADDKWHAYLGTPKDRLGVEILGLTRTDSYFMIGDDVPELPSPPDKVLKNLSRSKQLKLSNRSTYDMAQGSGIAFGQSMSVDFKAELMPFYASMGVGMGAEFLLKNYGVNAYCAGGEPPLGINGWYARAQAWAWVEADIGLQATLFGHRKKFSILDIAASTLLEGAGPNPFYFSGAVGGRFSVMGGLISGRCDFDFEIGDECKVMGGSPFGEEIIAQLTPSAGESDVNVFVAPQAVFNIPVGLEMEVEEDEGKKAWYRVTLEEFKCIYKATGKEVAGAHQLTDEGRVLVLDPDEALESQSDLLVRAKVGFERLVSGDWRKVLDYDGKPVYEEKEVDFKSGDRPKFILPEHVKYSYPVDRQYNYYSDEYDQGYLLLSENYNYLFSTEIPEGYTQELRLTDSNGSSQNTEFSYKTHAGGNEIRMEIDFSTAAFNFKNDEIYRLAILNIPETISALSDNISTTTTQLGEADSLFVQKKQAEGTLDLLEEDQIYAMNFRTSSYDTFTEKIGNVKGNSGHLWQLYPHVNRIDCGLYDYSSLTEMFDYSENNMPDATDNMVQVSPLYNSTPWFINQVKPLIYGNVDVLRASATEGLMPTGEPGVVTIGAYSTSNKLTDEMVRMNNRANVNPFGALNNEVTYYIDRDYKYLRRVLANTIVDRKLRTENLARFLATNHIPDQTSGNYGLEIRYVLPGKGIVTSKIERIIEVK
ncbi:hypothetical protein ACT3CD_01310 [Geofilum sp. OHC36d9]|uniref:hypothetical protein n=1 Tax=Geofilum sp. OHC36d9 TaxID=3458413 RepID=UPI004034B141